MAPGGVSPTGHDRLPTTYDPLSNFSLGVCASCINKINFHPGRQWVCPSLPLTKPVVLKVCSRWAASASFESLLEMQIQGLGKVGKTERVKCTPSCVQETANGEWLFNTGSLPGRSANTRAVGWVGSMFKHGGDVCIPTANSMLMYGMKPNTSV